MKLEQKSIELKNKWNRERAFSSNRYIWTKNIQSNTKTGNAAEQVWSESFGHYSAPKRILFLSLTGKPHWFLQVKSTVLLGANSMSESPHFRLGVFVKKIYSQKGNWLIKFSIAKVVDHIEDSETK